MNDIVKRLRDQANRPHLQYSAELMLEAAAEIERLRPFEQFAPRIVNVEMHQPPNKGNVGDLNFSPPSAESGVKSG